jgi:hypothetical protein
VRKAFELLADHPLLGRPAEKGSTRTHPLARPLRVYREVPLASGGRHRPYSCCSTPVEAGYAGE